jgi:hypothetical protein
MWPALTCPVSTATAAGHVQPLQSSASEKTTTMNGWFTASAVQLQVHSAFKDDYKPIEGVIVTG